MSDFLLARMEQLINISLTGIYTLFIYRLLNDIFIIRNKKILKILAYCFLVYMGGMMVFPEEVTGIIGIFLLFFITLFLFFEGKKIELFSSAALFCPILISTHFFTEDLGRMIWLQNKAMSPLTETILHSSTIALRIPIWYGIWYFTRKWIKKAHNLTTTMWLVIDLLSLSSFTSMIMLLNYIPDEKSMFAYPVAFACTLTGIACIYMTSYAAEKTKMDMEIQNLKYQQSYYEELDKNQLQIRKLRHDMRNHLNVVSTFLEQKEVDKAGLYLKELSDETSSTLHPFCSNSIVNSVLNAKYSLARSRQIDCFFHIEIDDLDKMDDISLCSLFANTLDNAIEAAALIPDSKERSITLKARCNKGFFSFEISNSKQNEVQKNKDHFITSKKDKSFHGFGLQNVKDIIEKYNGNLDISYTKNTFTVTALIGNML